MRINLEIETVEEDQVEVWVETAWKASHSSPGRFALVSIYTDKWQSRRQQLLLSPSELFKVGQIPSSQGNFWAAKVI